MTPRAPVRPRAAAPSPKALATTLGDAGDAWDALHRELEAAHAPLSAEWKPSTSDFGWMHVLKRRKRTVIYLTPEDGAIRVALVLGERAAARALESALPDAIKALIREARPYAEGRGIRFAVRSTADLPDVLRLVALKMAP